MLIIASQGLFVLVGIILSFKHFSMKGILIMKNIKIIDSTLCRKDSSFNFKEKIEIARQLEKLNVNVIELPEIENVKTDVLLAKTISSFVKNSVISIAAGSDIESIDNATAALVNAQKPQIRIELPVSPVGMEYSCHKKAPKMLQWIEKTVSYAKEKCENVEFSALDATRADFEFLNNAIETAINSGATSISISDDAAEMLPDDLSVFCEKIASAFNIDVAISCSNKNGLAVAGAILSVKKGIETIKTSVGGENINIDVFGNMIKNCGNNYGITTEIKDTEINRIVKQIDWIAQNAKNEKSVVSVASPEYKTIHLDSNDTKEDVVESITKLGYDLSDEDASRVYDEFLRAASKKKVGAKELDAIVASVALQVPPTYKLVSYVVNNGNIISSSAQISLDKNGEIIQDVCIGDGPIDAAFLAIDKIIGHHYELDDFQIQSITEGKEAMGSALVKLRSNGKLYSGNGISTDIIGASIRAYINAVNKIVYEEV